MNNKIIIKDKVLKKGFTQVSNIILRNPNISPLAKTVYSLLLSYAWFDNECFPSHGALAEDIGKSEDTVQRALNELKRKGLIDWKQRGLNISNIYYINDIPEVFIKDFENKKKKVEADTANMRHPETAPMRYKEYSKEEYTNINNNVNNNDFLLESETTDKEKKTNLKSQLVAGDSLGSMGVKQDTQFYHIEDGSMGSYAFNFFMSVYEQLKGVEHPKLKLKQLQKVLGNLNDYSFDRELEEEEWQEMIINYFKTDFKKQKVDYNINHFVEFGILENRFWKGVYQYQ